MTSATAKHVLFVFGVVVALAALPAIGPRAQPESSAGRETGRTMTGCGGMMGGEDRQNGMTGGMTGRESSQNGMMGGNMMGGGMMGQRERPNQQWRR